ncbi:MAG: TrkA C-terminal domain-containing protein [Huintestinicola sp.]
MVGKTIAEVQKQYDMRVFMILRGELNIIATDNLKICADDVLIIKSDKVIKQKNKKRRK